MIAPSSMKGAQELEEAAKIQRSVDCRRARQLHGFVRLMYRCSFCRLTLSTTYQRGPQFWIRILPLEYKKKGKNLQPPVCDYIHY
jgi:hypothetical protein